MKATVTETRKSLNVNLVLKDDVPIATFMLSLQMLTSEVKNIIYDSLISIWVTGKQNLNLKFLAF